MTPDPRPAGAGTPRPVPGLALALVLSACIGSPERPDLPEADALPETWLAATTEPGEVRGPWWEALGDERLPELVREAFEHNHDLRAAAHRMELAASQVAVARSGLFPQVGASADAARRRSVFVGFSGPGGEPFTTTFDSFSAGLGASWEVDLWGKLRDGVAAAEADALAARADLLAARSSLAAQVCRSWIGLREARLQRELSERTLATWEQNEAWLRARYDIGVASALDLRLVAANADTARAVVSVARDREQALGRALEVLLGRYPAQELDAPGDLADLPPPVPAGLPAELLERRPDLLAARLRLVSTRRLAEQARKDLLPSLTLSGDVGRTSTQLEDLLDGDFTTWGLGLALAQPLIDGGRRRAVIVGQDAQALAAAEDLAQGVLVACAEVEDALGREGLLQARLAARADALEESRAADSLAEEQYTSGLVNVLTVLESRRRLFLAEADWLAARRDLLVNRVDLHLALGGSFPPPPGALERADEQSLAAAPDPVARPAGAPVDGDVDGGTDR